MPEAQRDAVTRRIHLVKHSFGILCVMDGDEQPPRRGHTHVPPPHGDEIQVLVGARDRSEGLHRGTHSHEQTAVRQHLEALRFAGKVHGTLALLTETPEVASVGGKGANLVVEGVENQ